MAELGLLKDIALDVGLSEGSVLEIIQNAPRRYKVYQIPKKGGGQRTIAQPARELKPIQRSICHLVLDKFPVHTCAMAYRQGVSIFDNASIHAHSNILMKLDFETFFNSITASAWRRFLSSHASIEITRPDIALLTNALFWGMGTEVPSCLSIGAPSSPQVSNIIMFNFDTKMSLFAETNGLRYSRYADDITISAATPEKLLAFERHLRAFILRNRIPALKVNEKKRAIFSRAGRRLVTGLVITPEGKVSLGRQRKREISSLVHKHTLGQLNPEQVGYLHGMLAFALSSEPSFVARMSKKYGDKVVSSIIRYNVPRRSRPTQ